MPSIHSLRTPVSDGDLEPVKVGDTLYISGVIVTARDSAHRRLVVEGVRPPVSLEGYAVFHAGPVVKRRGRGWEAVSIGPTTSARMEPYEAEFIERTGVKAIVGKGFMGERTAEACRRHRCIVAMFPGGCGALASEYVKEVLEVYWLDLGMPEALWVLKVEGFGPLIVTIDVHGNNLFNERIEEVRRRARLVKNMMLNQL